MPVNDVGELVAGADRLNSSPLAVRALDILFPAEAEGIGPVGIASEPVDAPGLELSCRGIGIVDVLAIAVFAGGGGQLGRDTLAGGIVSCHQDNVSDASLNDLELHRLHPRPAELFGRVAVRSLAMKQHAAVHRSALPLAPGREAPAKFNNQAVVRVLLLGHKPTKVLAADSDGRRSVDLIDHREDPLRVVVFGVGQPGIEVGQILAVEQLDGLAFGSEGPQRVSRSCHADEGNQQEADVENAASRFHGECFHPKVAGGLFEEDILCHSDVISELPAFHGGARLPCWCNPVAACTSKSVCWQHMAWTKRQYSKGQIDRAGRALLALAKDDPRREEAIQIVDNWRSCHAYPLQVIKMTLLHRATKVDSKALIAQRLKRRPSIELKLQQNPQMKLSQMQDLGGGRAVLRTIRGVRELVTQYKAYDSKSPQDRSSWDGSDDYDYIKNPKADGYRGIHLVFRYHSPSPERAVYNGQRIEIQIRSKLQHLWATAVETAQVFTGQALKSRIKNATEEWLRFFALASSAFARKEKAPIVPATPEDEREMIEELRNLVTRTNIMITLAGWSETIHLVEDGRMVGAYTLLILDTGKRTLRVRTFGKDKAIEAQKDYEKEEKNAEDNSNVQVVLVAVQSLDLLRKAYPNYYVDTRDFMAAIHSAVGPIPRDSFQ